MAEEKKGTPTHEEVELELGDENNEAWERWAKENKAELERMEAERERENKAEASVENKNHAAEEANKQAREEERKKEEGKATELRVMILNLLDELSIAPGKYKKRLKENYGVTKIADLTNEEKMKEVAYLQGFKERIKSEKEAKGEEEIGLEYEFTKLRDKMSLSDITHFYEWLYSEYDVTNFGALNLKDKRAVLEELRKLIVTAQKKEEEKQKEKRPVEVEATIVEEVEKGEEKGEWQQRVVTDKGAFLFRFIDVDRGLLRCKNEVNGSEYALNITKPECSCPDFLINKQESEWCKHLKAARALGLGVKELPELPAVPVKEETVGKRKKVAKREEIVALDILDRHIDMPVQVPDPLIPNEERAVKMIIDILGPNPAREAVIEEFGNIEEISAGVILALAQYTGIRFAPLCKEIETVKMNLGKIFEKIPMDEKKKQNYLPLIEFMPETDVVIRCKMTTVAAWKDRAGNLRIGMGTKDEHLTPFELRDIVIRGTNFIETKCETKAAKKAILNALPVTHDGLLQKIKRTYSWD